MDTYAPSESSDSVTARGVLRSITLASCWLTLSAGSAFSMRLSAIEGCQFGSPLKSRTRAQTRSLRALMTLDT